VRPCGPASFDERGVGRVGLDRNACSQHEEHSTPDAVQIDGVYRPTFGAATAGRRLGRPDARMWGGGRDEPPRCIDPLSGDVGGWLNPRPPPLEGSGDMGRRGGRNIRADRHGASTRGSPTGPPRRARAWPSDPGSRRSSGQASCSRAACVWSAPSRDYRRPAFAFCCRRPTAASPMARPRSARRRASGRVARAPHRRVARCRPAAVGGWARARRVLGLFNLGRRHLR
jgi:hypothetical protein